MTELFVVEIKIGGDVLPGYFGEVLVGVELTPETAVLQLLAVCVPVGLDWLAQADGKVSIVGSRPSVGDAVAGEKSVVLNAERTPENFAVVVVDAVYQVDDDTCLFSLGRESVFVNTYTLGSSKLRADTVVGKSDLVVTRGSLFGAVRVTRTVAGIRIVFCTGVQAQFAGLGHDKNVTQVAVSGTAQVGMAETNDGGIVILVSGTIRINFGLVLTIDILRNGVGFRAELDYTERCAGSGEGVPHSGSTNHWINVTRPHLRLLCQTG